MCLLFAACDGGEAAQEAKCREKKREMLDKCQPGCEAAAELDACLDECALKEFGEEIPMCTK